MTHHLQGSLEQRAVRVRERVQDREVVIVGASKLARHALAPVLLNELMLLMKPLLLLATNCKVQRRIGSRGHQRRTDHFGHSSVQSNVSVDGWRVNNGR